MAIPPTQAPRYADAMERVPLRLRRARLERARLARLAEGRGGAALPRQRHVLRQIRALRRTVWLLLITPVAAAIQVFLLLIPGRAKVRFAIAYWWAVSHALGVGVRMIGRPAGGGGRRVIYVSNHSSWVDIPILGGRLAACFVSKDDVAAWPVIGTIARLGRTVFVSRTRAGTTREGRDIAARLKAGDDLILFPEGTSSDGARVLPFRSAFFAVAYGEGPPPLIQPVSLVYDRLAGLPVGHQSRPVFAWYGDMALFGHFWRLVQWRGKRATLLLHPPLDPADFLDRKALAATTWSAVASGADALRQNRPARAADALAPVMEGSPAFA